MRNRIKRLALEHVPGVKALRDLRTSIAQLADIKKELEKFSENQSRFDVYLKRMGINNPALYCDVIAEQFPLNETFLKDSMAQLDQDLFVLCQSQKKTGGFFVEFGATNGVGLSNTFLLEKHFGWTGILAEPGRSWHAELETNRSASIDKRCVYSKTGVTLEFVDASEHELSTIADFAQGDHHSHSRRDSQRYLVDTVSLNDLLSMHDAPEKIDYLSVDTEGSELEILNAFDFSRYDVRIITVEHNYTKSRDNIYDLLKRNGFNRKFEQYSYFDDWYVKSDAESI